TVLTAEDRNFWKHAGIDVLALVRAAVQWALKGHIVSGGSTITMQLAKNHFLSSEKTLHRKLIEMFLAVEIERRFNKSEILEAYLNSIFMGENTWGIPAAGEHYFERPVEQLDLAHAVRLAISIKAPSELNPRHVSETVRTRYKQLLHRLLEDSLITEPQYWKAIAAFPLAEEKGPAAESQYRYVTDWLTTLIREEWGEE